MDHPRPCGCKGRRTCLSCEHQFSIERIDYLRMFQNAKPFAYCPRCEKIYPGWDTDQTIEDHDSGRHQPEEGESFPGIYVGMDFLSVDEETRLMEGIDQLPWDDSQSGRRKQNFGPKTNFKKTKLKVGPFRGYPKFSEFVQRKFESVPLLAGYRTVEQCSLEYTPERGASIDPHIDDCWIWGERIVTVNMCADTVLTLSPYQHDHKPRYNLHFVDQYRDKLLVDLLDERTLEGFDNRIIRIPMPRRSLIVMYGPPRYQWEHSVLREDIKSRRVCLAYREFTPMYLEGGSEFAESEQVLSLSQHFWDHRDELGGGASETRVHS